MAEIPTVESIRKVIDWADGVYWHTCSEYDNDAGIPMPDFIVEYSEWLSFVVHSYLSEQIGPTIPTIGRRRGW